ncbi:sulfite exporter TauE/SafE family protein [Microvirga antarctica]|uniref:sulfite exporter TauE/SafE family protein n=1 Tax=Microvirga antarctica TaxID=2819233 RepID=UPI001B314C42|nr:sulfite exporter TauE/SafE family protein [Microvirga antarctica]
MITDPLFYCAAVPAVILLGLSKGGLSGLSLLSLPLMALTVSPVQAAAITLPILIVQDVVSVWAYRHTWDRRNVLILMPGALLGVVLAYLLAAWVSDALVGVSVGVISVAFGARRLIVERRQAVIAPARADIPRGVFWGAMCGFTSMIAHAGGPPFQIYVMPQRLPQAIFVGTGAIVFTLINWIKVPPYMALGQFTRENLSTAAVLFPLAIAATLAGVWLVRRLSGQRFYTIIYGLLILVGGKLIFDGVVGLS